MKSSIAYLHVRPLGRHRSLLEPEYPCSEPLAVFMIVLPEASEERNSSSTRVPPICPPRLTMDECEDSKIEEEEKEMDSG
jgi:hypothetical protein